MLLMKLVCQLGLLLSLRNKRKAIPRRFNPLELHVSYVNRWEKVTKAELKLLFPKKTLKKIMR
jgi:hypothetical protein